MEKARMLGMEEAVAGGTEGGRSPTGVPPATAAVGGPGAPAMSNGKPIPAPAVPEKPVRRRFTAEYKLRILREAADAGSSRGRTTEGIPSPVPIGANWLRSPGRTLSGDDYSCYAGHTASIGSYALESRDKYTVPGSQLYSGRS